MSTPTEHAPETGNGQPETDALQKQRHIWAGLFYAAVSIFYAVSTAIAADEVSEYVQGIAWTVWPGLLAVFAFIRAHGGNDALPEKLERLRRGLTFGFRAAATIAIVVAAFLGAGKLINWLF